MSLQMGVNAILQYNAGTEGSPVWVDVGEQVGGDLDISSNPVDTTTKGQLGWSRFSPTFSSWSFSLEGKVDNADAGINYLAAAATNRTEAHVRWYMKTAPTKLYTGKAFLEGWKISAPVDDAATWSTTLRGNGQLVETQTP